MFTKIKVIKYLHEWKIIDDKLDKIYKRGPNKWRWFIAGIIHDGRQTARKVRLVLDAKENEEITRHHLAIELTWFISVGNYVIDKEG